MCFFPEEHREKTLAVKTTEICSLAPQTQDEQVLKQRDCMYILNLNSIQKRKKQELRGLGWKRAAALFHPKLRPHPLPQVMLCYL
jgi:hypothetical protein